MKVLLRSATGGFGDGTPAEDDEIDDVVYFDEILLGQGNAEEPFNDGAVELDEDPFVNTYHGYPLYLKQGCPLIEAGAGYIDEFPYLLGKTTGYYPDSNMVNIGFHYPNWNFSNAGDTTLSADLNNDGTVNFSDFAILAGGWLVIYDMVHLEIMTDQWLYVTEPLPANIVPSFDKDINNLTGYVNVSIDASNPGIYKAFLLLDGRMYGGFGGLHEPETSTNAGIDTRYFSNGQHEVKVIVMYSDDSNVASVVCSEPVAVNFNNELHNLVANEGYRQGEDYCFYGIGSGDYQLDVNDCVNDVTVYSENFQGNIQAVVPASIFADYGIYKLTLEEQVQEFQKEMMIAGVETTGESTRVKVDRILARVFNKKDFPPDCLAEMVISCGNDEISVDKMDCIIAVTTAAVIKDMRPIYLSPTACTWENLRYCLRDIVNVKKWYHVAHGNYDLFAEPPRQCIDTADGKVFSYLRRNVKDANNYTALSWYYENNHSLADLGFSDSKKLNWVQFNCCFSASTEEFPLVLGVLPIDDPYGIGDKVFIGWQNEALVYSIIGKYNQFEKVLWKTLGQGNTLLASLNEATIAVPDGIQIRNNFTCYGLFQLPQGMQNVIFQNGPIN